MFPFLFDWTFLLILPAFAFAMWAQSKVRGTYKKYSNVPSRSRLTGRDVARRILDSNGLQSVEVEPIAGELTDHYHPKDRKIRLSEGIYNSNSLAALAVAAHESGHALQHQAGYTAMTIRANLVPVANLGSSAAFPMFFIGMIFPAFSWLMDLGIIFFAGAVLFHVVTLPVEFDASARAVKILGNGSYLAPDEVSGARKVLDAAAWTYVAAAAMALLNLVRLLIRRGRN
jgi:Zn-dependent membrane protease YugP